MLGRGPLIRLFLFISLVAASLDAAAEDLVQVYRDAQRYDAVYSGARYALEAGREKLPQGRSLLLPTLGLTGSVTKSRIDSESRDPATAPNLNFLRRPEVDSRKFRDRKSTRLNSSHQIISYAVFCLKKKKQ